MNKPIRVLLVDDSPLALAVLRQVLTATREIEVVGTARNGQEALGLVARLDPDVVCTDMNMPVMDGLEFTRQLMARDPRPILVISSVVEEGSQSAFDLLDAGALDVFPKPRSGEDKEYEQVGEELRRKVRVLAGVHVFRKLARKAAVPSPSLVRPAPALTRISGIVAIGASTGGPGALQAIFSDLPAQFPAPILCVQHISDGFLPPLVKWLASHCALTFRIASDGEPLKPGTVYFAPCGAHLELRADNRLVHTHGEAVDWHRPSATVTMRSVSKCAGPASIGVLLTGMGRDGAEGLKSILDAGGVTIVQDEETSTVFGMPQRAIELGAAQFVLPVGSIAAKLRELVGTPPRS